MPRGEAPVATNTLQRVRIPHRHLSTKSRATDRFNHPIRGVVSENPISGLLIVSTNHLGLLGRVESEISIFRAVVPVPRHRWSGRLVDHAVDESGGRRKKLIHSSCKTVLRILTD